MKCPHCNVAINVEWDTTNAFEDSDDSTSGTEVAVEACPDCRKLIVKLVHGKIRRSDYAAEVSEVQSEKLFIQNSRSG